MKGFCDFENLYFFYLFVYRFKKNMFMSCVNPQNFPFLEIYLVFCEVDVLSGESKVARVFYDA